MKHIIFVLLKVIAFFITSAVIILLIAFAVFFFVSKNETKKINQTPKYLINTVYSAFTDNSFKNNEKLNILLLGLDPRDDRLEKTETTDTIMFISLYFTTSKATTFSLPRDIWNYELNTKINGIYPLSLESQDSTSFIKMNFENLLKQKIDRVLVISTSNLKDFIQIVGGVDVYLDKGFKDTKYPNPDYISNPKAPIYKTIEFPAGVVHINESNVNEFVRSRKGGDTPEEGGTDIGRIARQQLLMEALMAKLQNKDTLKKPETIYALYNFFHQKIASNLTDKDLVSVIFRNPNIYKNFKINKVNIPIGTNPKNSVIYHPDKFINKQWVFTTSDDTYSSLQKFISDNLN